MRPINPETWALFFEQAVAFLRGHVSTPETISSDKEELPIVSFPVYYEREVLVPNDPLGSLFSGSLVFIEGEIEAKLSENPKPLVFSDCDLRRGFELSRNIEPALREAINQQYPHSGRFLSFVGHNIEFRENVITSGLMLPEIDGSSFHLATAVFLFFQPLKNKIERKCISLSGELLIENGTYRVKPIRGIFEKLAATLPYPIEKLYIPQGNKDELDLIVKPLQQKGVAKKERNKIIITMRERSLEVVYVSKLKDVLNDLLGEYWQKNTFFRQIYDLGYQYKQAIKNSEIVKIKNILGDTAYSEMKSYVKLRIIKSGGIEKNIKEEEQYNDGDNGKADEESSPLIRGSGDGRIVKKQSPISPLTLLAEFSKEDQKKIVIFGQAGAGKSTLLRNLLYAVCEDQSLEMKDCKDLVPLLTPFGSFHETKEGLAETIIDHFDIWTGLRQFAPALKAYLKTLHTENKILFLLDAFDEIRTNWDNVGEQIKNLGNTIVTTRYTMRAPRGDVYEILPLDVNSIRALVKNHVTDKRKQKKIDLFLGGSSGVQNLIANPLMLWLIILTLRGDKELEFDSLTRTKLVTKGVEVLINKRLKEQDHEFLAEITGFDDTLSLVNKVFGKIAFDCFFREDIKKSVLQGEIRSIIAKHKRKESIRKLVDLSLESLDVITTGTGILEEFRREKRREREVIFYKFFHDIFHEFFVATYIVDNFSYDKFRVWISEHISDIRYTGVFRFIAGLLDMRIAAGTHKALILRPEEGLELLFDIVVKRKHMLLGVQCLGEVTQYEAREEDNLVNFVVQHLDENPVKSAILDFKPSGHRIAVKIIPLLNGSKRDRLNAVTALSIIGSKIAVDPLINALKNDNPIIRSSVAEALGQFRSRTTTEALAATLGDTNRRVRLACYGSLARIGSKQAVNVLIDIFRNVHINRRLLAKIVIQNDISGVSAAFIDMLDPGQCQSLDSLVRKVTIDNPYAESVLIKKAYFWQIVHLKSKRPSNNSAIHCLSVAHILADMKVDLPLIISSLLYEPTENAKVNVKDIREIFGDEISSMVNLLLELSKVMLKATKETKLEIETFGRILIMIARDKGVLLVKLADQLYNMRIIQLLPKGERQRIASETLEVYAPLADRLGIKWLQTEMEDLSFQYLMPERYREIVEKVSKPKEKKEKYLGEVMELISHKLKEEDVACKVSGRVRNYYGIYRKMQEQAIPFEMVSDIFRIMIITSTKADCYGILGLIHSLWAPVPGKFRDYIGIPKSNMYQSIHTTVIGPKGERVKFIIRTSQMHMIAEHGIASHWRYKEGRIGEKVDRYISWLRELIQRELSDSKDFLEAVRAEVVTDVIYVFTPKGEIKEMPVGSTPVDFAYIIHTEVGNKCVSAKVNGRIVPLKFALRNGDTVEIITSRAQNPRMDWLKFVVTKRAKIRIKQWIKAEERKQSAELGIKLLEGELRRHDLSVSILKSEDIQNVLNFFSLPSLEDLHASVGYGKLSAQQIVNKLLPGKLEEIPVTKLHELPKKLKGITIKGVDNVLYHRAKCCFPVPGDSLIGLVARRRGVVIHRKDCLELDRPAIDAARLVDVEWKPDNEATFPARLLIETVDKPGILAGLSALISSVNVSITNLTACSTEDQRAHITFILEIKDLNQLYSLINKISEVEGVLSVKR